MLLTDKTALEKANEIIRKSIKNTTIPKWFWVHAEEEKDDIQSGSGFMRKRKKMIFFATLF